VPTQGTGFLNSLLSNLQRLLGGRGGVWTTSCLNYFPILYVRSPAAFLDDSIFSPPLLPRMLTKPRTVCGCQPVAFMISASVAPLARFISAITSAFLLVRSVFGLPVGFLARFAFFAGLAFFPAWRFGFSRWLRRPLHCIDCVLAHWFLLDRVAVVTFITPLGRNSKGNLR
jgi:hypothetical protein